MWLMFDTVSVDGKLTMVGKGQIDYGEVCRIRKLFEFTSSYSIVKMMEDVVIRNHKDCKDHMNPENLNQYQCRRDEAVIIANQCALNYASSIQSFIDVTERQLRKTRPSDREITLYEQFQNQMYDSHVEYRFWMRLRNFIVHCSFPYTRFTHDKDGVRVICSKDHLLTSGKWNAVKQDILQMEDTIPIEQMLGKVTGCISALRLAFVGMYAEDIALASREYAAFCKHYGVRQPIFIEAESEEQIGINGISLNPLPVEHLIEALDDLKKVPFVKLNMI